ncbi:MAG: hypothetical protein U0T36_05700 [Saprospiraceae bacterium]
MKIFNVFLLFILLNSCTYDHYHIIPDEVEPFVNEFFQDANRYGKNISLDQYMLNISFTNLNEADGRCYFDGNKILIDSYFWNNANQYIKRWLIYHELGHCILDRRHDESSFPNGECKSIMRGGFDCSENIVSKLWWEYYLDELFNGKNSLPDWYDLNAKPVLNYTSNYEKWDTTLMVDNGLERTPDLLWTFTLDYKKDFQLVFYYPGPSKGIVPKLKTKSFLFSSFYNRIVIYQYLSNDNDLNQTEIFESKNNNGGDTKLTMKYKGKLLYFFKNDALIHISEYEFKQPIEIYNLNFRENTVIEIEAGNI